MTNSTVSRTIVQTLPHVAVYGAAQLCLWPWVWRWLTNVGGAVAEQGCAGALLLGGPEGEPHLCRLQRQGGGAHRSAPADRARRQVGTLLWDYPATFVLLLPLQGSEALLARRTRLGYPDQICVPCTPLRQLIAFLLHCSRDVQQKRASYRLR